MSQPPRANRAAMGASAVVHAALLLGLVVVAGRASEPEQLVYQVNLLAAPAPREAPRRAAEAAIPTAQEPEVAPPEEQKPAPREEKPPEPETPKPQAAREDRANQTRSETTPLPGEAPSTGNDEITFRQEGIQFQYPEYLERIVTEIRRRWVRPARSSRLRVTVDFTIERDGSVTGVRVARTSGDYTFNLEALGAVERAGRDGAFGPLPEGYNGVSLPIAFTFKPENQ